ncbi:hypothetical protein DPMN_179838 [Dreissena polymorpha]|uniref:Uncharacterized protein n=1 Tax=Dreissena polymorpha TaxID=45954 RepID=A0A9D4EHZ2_DREPO|nr:hypothetical protein DPMN_179838 [Dreissena polymorpha]
MFLYVGFGVDPPEKPTRVRLTPGAQPNCASGNQNQLSANVALLTVPGMVATSLINDKFLNVLIFL